jgi:hypothetical protein
MGFDTVETVGYLHKVKGFDHYNHLLTVNQVFSALPMHDIVDRTNLALGPVRFSPVRSWSVPQTPLDLDTALSNRVRDICDTDQKINIMWSGGIDSTAIVVSFLKYAPDIQQCRILYSPWSIYEHPDFFELLQNYTNLELIDISGDFYLDMNLDGLFVSGNSGDTVMIFYSRHGEIFSTAKYPTQIL